MVRRNQLLLSIFVPCLCFAQPTIGFAQSTDGQILTTQIRGVTFTIAAAKHAGVSLNEVSFPVKSGTVAAVDRGGPMSIEFGRPAASFSAFVTHTKRVTVSAYDATGKLLRSAISDRDMVRRYDPAAGTVTRVGGQFSPSKTGESLGGDGGPATRSRLFNTGGPVFDRAQIEHKEEVFK